MIQHLTHYTRRKNNQLKTFDMPNFFQNTQLHSLYFKHISYMHHPSIPLYTNMFFSLSRLKKAAVLITINTAKVATVQRVDPGKQKINHSPFCLPILLFLVILANVCEKIQRHCKAVVVLSLIQYHYLFSMILIIR